ncbi:MAG: hypothetical protein AABX07_01635, partial [Nanoarchaeota archaeon]
LVWPGNNRRLILNKENNLTLRIENRGNEKTANGSLKLYVKENSAPACIEGEECPAPEPPILLMSKDIEIDKDSDLSINFSYTPTKKGGIVLITEMNADNLAEPENTRNYFYIDVLEEGPDIRAELEIHNNMFVNSTEEIGIIVRNRGTETAREVNFSLYAAKEKCNIRNTPLSSCENVRLIYSNYSAELRADARIENIVRFTPSEKGQFSFVLIANASRDVNLENNFLYRTINVAGPGANLESSLVWPGNNRRLILNKENNLTLQIENRGNEKTVNSSLKLYTVDKYCNEYTQCDNPQLILEKEMEIDKENSLEVNFSYTPNKKGDITFIAEMNANNLAEPENTRNYFYIDVLEEGPDIRAELEIHNNMFVNSTEEIRINVYNRGTETARDVNFSLYAAKGYCNIGNMPLSSCEDVKLIYSNYSAELRADARIENIVKFTPSE